MAQVKNKSRSVVLADHCEIADTFTSRFWGLMFRKSLADGNSLLLKPCNSIHMLFMKFPIDVLFIDADNKVIGCCKGIKPWRTSSVFWKSVMAFEFPAGVIDKTETAIGDVVVVEGP